MVTSTVYAHVLTEQADQAADTFARLAGIDEVEPRERAALTRVVETIPWSVSAKRDLRSGLWFEPWPRFARTHPCREMGCQHPA